MDNSLLASGTHCNSRAFGGPVSSDPNVLVDSTQRLRSLVGIHIVTPASCAEPESKDMTRRAWSPGEQAEGPPGIGFRRLTERAPAAFLSYLRTGELGSEARL